MAEDDMPQEVQDMIVNFTQDLHSGKARADINSMKSHGVSPYSIHKRPVNVYQQRSDYNRMQAMQAAKQKELEKAKFILNFKVISCHKDKLPEYVDTKTISHEACGDLDSQIMYEDTVDVYLTKESRFNNLKSTKLIRTVPTISLEDGNYAIKDEKTLKTVKLGVEVFAKPTTIIGKKIKMDLAVRTVELAENEEIFLDSNDKNFINNGIGFKHRFLSASFPVALNQTEILGGNSAILAPKTNKLSSKSSYPEDARLWLEVTLKMPQKQKYAR